MAYHFTFLLLFLLVFHALSVDCQCPKICSCGNKKAPRRVNCRGRGITEIFDSREFPSDMLVLDLSRNNITVVRRQFLDRHAQLEKLYLHKNSIRVIEDRAFVGLSKLNRLLLKQNNLVKIKPSSFLGLISLDTLDLSQNKIKYIDNTAFTGLNKISKILLNNNSIKALENGTFDGLRTLKKINLRNVPLDCNCKLNPFINFLTSFHPPVKVDGTCYHSKTKFNSLRGINLCDAPPQLSIFPSTDQVVAVGDSFVIECRGEKQPVLHLGWTKNGKAIRKKDPNVLERKRTIINEMVITFEVKMLTEKNAGVYTCSADRAGVVPKSVKINIVSSFQERCTPRLTKSDRGNLLWPTTVAGTTTDLACTSLVKENNRDTTVRRTCTPEGTWGEVIYGNCRRMPLFRELIELEKLIADTDLAVITSKLKTLTAPPNIENYTDITFILNIVAAVVRKQGDKQLTTQVLDDLLETFNNVMDADQNLLYNAQKTDQSPSRLAAHLELLSRRSAARKLSRVFSNIVIGSVDIQEKDFRGKNCRVFFKDGKSSRSDGVQCQPQKRKDYVVAVHIPKSLFRNLQVVAPSVKTNLTVQFLVYKNSKLLPKVTSNKTEELLKRKYITSSVLAMQLAHIEEVNLTEPITISFGTKAGIDPVISHFDFGEKVVGKSWSANHDCHVNRSNDFRTTVTCRRMVNKNLAVMSGLADGTILVFSVEIVVYFGAIVASLFLLATLITFAVFRDLRFNHDDILLLMNACFSLLVIITTFAFGINRTTSDLVCLVVGLLVHFFFLASLLWLGSYVVCVTRKLRQPKESDEEFNPVLRYYMVSWGVPAIICGITLAGDLRNYHTIEYCWLTESAGLGAFVGPACLLFIINCVLLVRLHLLLARGAPSQPPKEEDSEEERLHTEEPAVLEITQEPGNESSTEKSSMTLSLVATWVVMSLIYVNFILAYLLLKFRRMNIAWKVLSYIYAIANIALGVSVFLFHCLARSEVRNAWKNAWKRVRAIRVNINPCWAFRVIRRLMAKRERAPINRGIFINGEEYKDSDRQSNITLPSSAALTNDIFVNGRPLSTRISLLDEADFPQETGDGAGAVNEVDITESVNRRSQSSVYSDRKSATHSQLVSKPPSEAPLISEETISGIVSGLFPPENDEVQADVTSKSESSAPTAIEVPMSSTPHQDSKPSPPAVAKPVSPVDTVGSRSSSSLSETPIRPPTFKRKRSSESLNSRTGSARKVPVYNGYPSSSSTFSELAVKSLEAKRPRIGDPVNARGPVHQMGPNGATQMPRNRYKDGREKPEPKQWTGTNGHPKLTYVPVPHVSKIHRQPTRNETSV